MRQGEVRRLFGYRWIIEVKPIKWWVPIRSRHFKRKFPHEDVGMVDHKNVI